MWIKFNVKFLEFSEIQGGDNIRKAADFPQRATGGREGRRSAVPQVKESAHTGGDARLHIGDGVAHED